MTLWIKQNTEPASAPDAGEYLAKSFEVFISPLSIRRAGDQHVIAGKEDE